MKKKFLRIMALCLVALMLSVPAAACGNNENIATSPSTGRVFQFVDWYGNSVTIHEDGSVTALAPAPVWPGDVWVTTSDDGDITALTPAIYRHPITGDIITVEPDGTEVNWGPDDSESDRLPPPIAVNANGETVIINPDGTESVIGLADIGPAICMTRNAVYETYSDGTVVITPIAEFPN